MSSLSMHIFRVGTQAVVLEEISHWWVAPGAHGGPALCFSMKNGKQLNFGPEQTPDGTDGYAVELSFVDYLQRCDRA